MDSSRMGEKRPLLGSYSAEVKTPKSEDDLDSLFLDKKQKQKLMRSDYVTIIVLCIDIICHGMGYALIATFYPVIAQTKGLTLTDVGIVMAALPIATIVFGIVFSYLLPIMGTRKMLLLSLVIEALSLLPFAFVMEAPSGWPFYTASVVCRLGQGIAFVASQVAAFSIVAGDYNERLGTMMGLLEMALGVGLSLGPAAGGFFYDLMGFKFPFFFLCITSVVMLVGTYFSVYPKYSYTDTKKEDQDAMKKNSLNYKTIFTMPEVFLPLLVCMAIFMNWTFFDVALAPFFSEEFGLSATIIGLIFLLLAGCYAFLAPIVGYIVELKGHNGLVLVLGCFIVSPAFLFIGPIPFLKIGHILGLSIAALLVIYCACALMYVPGMGLCFEMTLARNIEDNEYTRGFISSAFVLAGNIGNLLGPFLGGILIDNVGFEWTTLFYSLATLIIGVLTSIYLLRMRKVNKAEDEHLLIKT